MRRNTSEDSVDPRVMSGEIWEEFCDTLRGAGDLIRDPDTTSSPLERATAIRYLTEFLAAGIDVCVAHSDPDYPELTRLANPNMRWGLNSPDCLYLIAPLRDDASYRLWGDPGTANHLDLQVNTGHPSDGDIQSMRTLATIAGRELKLEADGSVEIFIGGDERNRNWLPIGEGARHLLFRQNFSDWENERPAELLIERIGGAVGKMRERTDEIAARMDQLQSWIAKGGPLWETLSRGMRSSGWNALRVFTPGAESAPAGVRGQIHCQGNFRCAADEALLIQFDPPLCHHWNISLVNLHWQSIDFVGHQSSLNGHQARLDPSGTFWGVLAHEDPGVHNWLDPVGHERGSLFGRFLQCEAELEEPKVRVVKLDRLWDELSHETPRVTKEEREHTLRRRRNAAWKRYRV